MARPLRIEYPGAFYHVTSRGNERKTVLKSRRDREQFLGYLQSATERYGARQVKLYFSHRYSGLKLKKSGWRYGISESGVTQASRRVRLKIEVDKKFARMITKIAKYVNV